MIEHQNAKIDLFIPNNLNEMNTYSPLHPAQ